MRYTTGTLSDLTAALNETITELSAPVSAATGTLASATSQTNALLAWLTYTVAVADGTLASAVSTYNYIVYKYTVDHQDTAGMSVFNAINAALYSTLSAGTALTTLLSSTTALYNMQAPDGATFDYVVWNVQGGGDDNMTAHRTKNLVVFVRGYSSTSAARAGSIDAKIDSLLHKAILSVSGWSNFWSAREEDISTVEVTEAGNTIWCAGGMYRLRLAINP